MATQAEIIQVLKLRDEASAKLKTADSAVKKYSKSTTDSTKKTSTFGSSLGGLAQKVGGLNPAMLGAAGAAAALVGGLVSATKQTIALGTQLADVSSRTGLSTTALQELKFAGEQAGVGFNVMTDAVQRLGRRAAAELPEATKGIAALGLSVEQLISMEPGAAFELVAEKLGQIESPAQQAAIGMGVFGDAGLRVLPAINQGLTENIQRFRDLNVTMDEGSVAAAKRLGDQLTDLSAKWTGLKTIVGSAVIPILSRVLEAILNVGESLRITGNMITVFAADTVRALIDGLGGALVKVSDIMALLPGSAGDAFTGVGDAIRGVQADAAGFVSSIGDDARKALVELTAGSTTAGKATMQLGNDMSFAGGQADELADKAAALAVTLGKQGVVNSALELERGLLALNASGGQLSSQGLDQVIKKIAELKREGLELPPTLDKINQKFREFGTTALQSLPRVTVGLTDAAVAADNFGVEFQQTGDVLRSGLQAAGLEVDKTKDKTKSATDITAKWADVMSELRGVFNIFGISAESRLGKVLAGATKVFDTFNSLSGIIGKVAGLFGGGGGGGGGLFGGLLGSIGSIFGGGGGGGGGIAGAASGIAGAGTTAGTGFVTSLGSAASSGLSSLASTLVPLFTNPFTIGIGAALAGVFALKKIFGGPSNFERVGEELGLAIGEGAQFGIVNLFEQRGGTIGQAIQLSLGEVIKEQVAAGTANFDQLTQKAADTFSFLERGEISATEAQGALNESVAQLLPHLNELGPAGTEQLQRIVGASEQFGVQFSGLQEIVAHLAETLGTQVVAGANAAADALASVQLPGNVGSVPSVGNVGNVPRASLTGRAGIPMRKLRRDTVINAHRGEFAAVLTGRQAKGADVAHAQNGFVGRGGGGGGPSMGGGPTINIENVIRVELPEVTSDRAAELARMQMARIKSDLRNNEGRIVSEITKALARG